MDIFAYLLLQIINGSDWKPLFGDSSKYKNWIAVLDTKTCLECRFRHGKIWITTDKSDKEPPLHSNCRCSILVMKTVKSGTATVNRTDGADWFLKHNGKLPDYYISGYDAKNSGWTPILANLSFVCPNQMIFGGEYYNKNGHLPSKNDRVWYEADINYKSGYRNQSENFVF